MQVINLFSHVQNSEMNFSPVVSTMGLIFKRKLWTIAANDYCNCHILVGTYNRLFFRVDFESNNVMNLLVPKGINHQFKFTIMDASFITLYILTWFGASYFIAALLGEKRMIGFWPSFTLSVLLTPVVGFIATYLSKRKEHTDHEGTLV